MPVKYKVVQRNIELNMRGKFKKKKFYKLTCSSPWGILCLSWICTGPRALTLSMNQLTFRRLVCWGRAAIFNTFKTWATVSYSVTTWVTLLLLKKENKNHANYWSAFFPQISPSIHTSLNINDHFTACTSSLTFLNVHVCCQIVLSFKYKKNQFRIS